MNSFSKKQRLNLDVLAADTKQFAQYISGMDVVETERFVAVNICLLSYNFNIITLLSPFQQNKSSGLLQFINQLKAQGLPFNVWCFAEDLLAINWLQAQQLQLYPETYMAMHTPVTAIQLHSTDITPHELVIIQGKTAEHLKHFAKVLQTIYPDPIEQRAINAYYECVGETVDLNNIGTKLFIGYYKNCPVATGAFTIKGKSAGIFHIATKKQYRGLGFATQMVNYLLKQLKSKHILDLILQSSAAGKGIYESFGFQSVGELKVFENKDRITSSG